MMKRLASVLLALALLAVGSDAGAQETPRLGGVLKVATIGEPPTLDIPMSTAAITYEIMWHVNETLFHVVTDGGQRHTITLRKGVKFHNGKEMTAAKDPYTVVLSLKQPSASLLFGLAEANGAIYPKEVVETARTPPSPA
jgi:hypothetical protein